VSQNSSYLLATVATPIDRLSAYLMKNACCFLLMHTINWPSIRTGKDGRNILNIARDMLPTVCAVRGIAMYSREL
jgi:hypothetical protein